MAAQKLTKGRLVQIIIMLVILIAVFTWRTVTYVNDETIDCIVSKPCQFGIEQHNVLISGYSKGHGKIMNIPVNKGLLAPSKDTQNPWHTSLFCASHSLSESFHS